MLLLDLAIYLQHVMFHAVPGLWRLHRMHHADLDFDATTGLRFHPVEILISMGIKLAVVAALGPPAVAVLLFASMDTTTKYLVGSYDPRLVVAVRYILHFLLMLAIVGFVAALIGILSFVSLYVYEHPHHHCPFCILKPEYDYQGYLLYIPLFAAAAAGL